MSLHLHASLYFQIWLKWECVTFIFKGENSLPHLHYTFPHSKEAKERSPTHRMKSSSCLSACTFSFFYRATAFGILNGLCKFGAILGNTIFASFVGITKVVPILLAATSLVGGGLIALRLPETREQVLMWTSRGERKRRKNLSGGPSGHPHFLSVTALRTLEAPGGDVDFATTPSLGPISALRYWWLRWLVWGVLSCPGNHGNVCLVLGRPSPRQGRRSNTLPGGCVLSKRCKDVFALEGGFEREDTQAPS